MLKIRIFLTDLVCHFFFISVLPMVRRMNTSLSFYSVCVAQDMGDKSMNIHSFNKYVLHTHQVPHVKLGNRVRPFLSSLS